MGLGGRALLQLARKANALPWAVGLALLQALQTSLIGASSNISAGFYSSLVDGSESRFLSVLAYACMLYASVSFVTSATDALGEMAALYWRLAICRTSQRRYCSSYGFLWMGQADAGAFCAPKQLPTHTSSTAAHLHQVAVAAALPSAAPGAPQPSYASEPAGNIGAPAAARSPDAGGEEDIALPKPPPVTDVPGAGVDTPDQRLTSDLDLATSTAAVVVQAISGVPLSLVVYGTMAARVFDSVLPLVAGAAYFLCGAAAQRALMGTAARLTYKQEALEGQLRSAHARLRSCADALTQAAAAPYESAHVDALLCAAAANRRTLVLVRWGLGALTKAVDYGGALLCYGCVAVAVMGGGWGPHQHPNDTSSSGGGGSAMAFAPFSGHASNSSWGSASIGSGLGGLHATEAEPQGRTQREAMQFIGPAAPMFGALTGIAGAALLKHTPSQAALALGILATYTTTTTPAALHATFSPFEPLSSSVTPQADSPSDHHTIQQGCAHEQAGFWVTRALAHMAFGLSSRGGVAGDAPFAQDTTPGDVAARVAKASFLLLTFIYSLTSLLDLSGKVSTLLGAASRVAQLNDALDAHDQQQEQQRKEHWKQQEQRQRKEHREQQEQQQRKEHREQQQRQLDCGVQHQPGRAANLVDHDCTAQQQQQQQQQQHKSVHCAEGVAALVVKSLSIWAPALCAEASSSAGDEDQGVGAIAPGQRKERWSKQQTGGGGGGVGRRLVKEVQRAWVLAARGVGRGLGRALPMLQEDEVEGGQEPLLGRTCVEEDGWQSHSRNGKHTQGTANTHTEPFLGQTRTDGVRCRGEEVGGVGGLESPSYTLRCHDDCQGHCDQLEQGQRQEECRQQQQQWQQQGQLQEQHHGLKHPQLGQQQAGCRQQQQEEQQQGQLQGRQRPGGRLKLLLANLDLQLQPGQRLLVVGPDGCGKTSLVRCLLGLWRLHTGHVSISAPSASLSSSFLGAQCSSSGGGGGSSRNSKSISGDSEDSRAQPGGTQPLAPHTALTIAHADFSHPSGSADCRHHQSSTQAMHTGGPSSGSGSMHTSRSSRNCSHQMDVGGNGGWIGGDVCGQDRSSVRGIVGGVLVLTQSAVCAPGPTTLRQQLLYPSLDAVQGTPLSSVAAGGAGKEAEEQQPRQQQQQQGGCGLEGHGHIGKAQCHHHLQHRQHQQHQQQWAYSLLEAGRHSEHVSDEYMAAVLCAVGLGGLLGWEEGPSGAAAAAAVAMAAAAAAVSSESFEQGDAAAAAGPTKNLEAGFFKCGIPGMTEEGVTMMRMGEGRDDEAATCTEMRHSGFDEERLESGLGLLRNRVQDWSSVLSPGQLQRLAVARALCARPVPALLVLDEALGSVPEQEEAALHQLLISVLCMGAGFAKEGPQPADLAGWSSEPCAENAWSGDRDLGWAAGVPPQVPQLPLASQQVASRHHSSLQPAHSHAPASQPRTAIITISHRPSSLRPLHDVQLSMHGGKRGGWHLVPLTQ